MQAYVVCLSIVSMPEEFDQKLAASFIGKHILVGITYLNPAGELIEQRQMHGDVLRISEKEGMVIALRGSAQELKLPPDLSSCKVAPPGEYTLRACGEVVLNPDLICTWTLTKPAN